ncbi:D-alanyl-D-alanine carboxypeptidase family protein [Cytobacillus oceanisediminis]|uniref:D-alanyl-D-alanine carboxypeptidase family protein n=1 Tax=Cytobacillus oceanisediminis TaxID=665099 RepID=UPI001C2398DB|nr:D-alanyl-D-alanine carboxypeptidase family protein [Cytobacillus oceanisediminis]MBU8771943.1 D-alanyl-D-alanine carboxypeptidase [Cytobacillus oceanisediminis]
MKKLLAFILLLFSFPTAYAAAEEPKDPAIISEAAIVTDSESGAVLYAKNADKKMYPASLTKIATAIYAIENGNLKDIATISKKAAEVEGTRVYLEEGEKVPLIKLVQGMLINSGNDAAWSIAEHLDGNMKAFSENLNHYLEESAGLKNTHFVNPHGLFDENHYTTAGDLAKLTNYALKNETFREIYGTKEMKWAGKSWDTTIFTHHRMLKGEVPFEGVTGGKTGFVDEAKQTLATSAENDSIKLTAIVLKAEFKRDIYNDTKNLLNYGFSNFETSTLSSTDVFPSDGKTYTTGGENVAITLPKGIYEEDITSKGKLQIKNENGRIIQSVKLLEDKQDEVVTSQLKTEKDPGKETTGYYGRAGLIIFLFGIFILILRKNLKAKARRRRRGRV